MAEKRTVLLRFRYGVSGPDGSYRPDKSPYEVPSEEAQIYLRSGAAVAVRRNRKETGESPDARIR